MARDLTGAATAGSACGRTGHGGVWSGVNSTMEDAVARLAVLTPRIAGEIAASSTAGMAIVRAVRTGKVRMSEPRVDERRGALPRPKLDGAHYQRHGRRLHVEWRAAEPGHQPLVP